MTTPYVMTGVSVGADWSPIRETNPTTTEKKVNTEQKNVRSSEQRSEGIISAKTKKGLIA
jgi:hypothetical protein